MRLGKGFIRFAWRAALCWALIGAVLFSCAGKGLVSFAAELPQKITASETAQQAADTALAVGPKNENSAEAVSLPEENSSGGMSAESESKAISTAENAAVSLPESVASASENVSAAEPASSPESAAMQTDSMAESSAASQVQPQTLTLPTLQAESPLEGTATLQMQAVSVETPQGTWGGVSAPEDFLMGSNESAYFNVAFKAYGFTTQPIETYHVIVPYGFEVGDLPENAPEPEIVGETTVCTLPLEHASDSADSSITIKPNFSKLLHAVEEGRNDFTFSSNVVLQGETTEIPAGSFTITLPEMATYSVSQSYVYNNTYNDIWTPNDFAGVPTAATHWANQANTLRPGRMTKPLQVLITKPAGSLLPEDWSVDLPLPLEFLTLTSGQELCQVKIRTGTGNWTTLANVYPAKAKGAFVYTNPEGATSVISVADYGIATKCTTYTSEKVISLTDGLVDDSLSGLYGQLCQASEICFSFIGDVKWDNTFNHAGDPITSDILADNEENFTADAGLQIIANGSTAATGAPLEIHLRNGTGTALKADIATVKEIQMDTQTTKSGGYLGSFQSDLTKNYAYHTNLELTYNFPYEYCPVGTITLVPNAGNGGAGSGEVNNSCYDYFFTITDHTSKETRVVPKLAVSYNNPASYTPDLADGEWVSQVRVVQTKSWKNNVITDNSSGTNVSVHAVFYANMQSRSETEDGVPLTNGAQAVVTTTAKSDQCPLTSQTRSVTLIGPEDNLEVWSIDASANRYPIGQYGEATLKYLELHAKKYTDTRTYADPYIELTGEATALLSKVTHTSVISSTKTNYLTLRGYRLNTGTWIDVSADEAESLLDASGAYYDLSSKIPDGSYLTGLRLAPLDLNATTVDTTGAADASGKHYQDNQYNLYLYDKVLPGYLGYDATLGQTYTNIADLDACLSYDITFHCDIHTAAHTPKSHVLADKDTVENKRTATLIYGDLPGKIFARDNEYMIQAAPDSVNYTKTELLNVGVDDGPASSSSSCYWGAMSDIVMSFDTSTADQRNVLALTKGVSLAGAIWQNPTWRTNENFSETIRYKTNLSGDWVEMKAVNSKNSANRSVNYFPLAEGEYVTDLEVVYPSNYLYQSGYDPNGNEYNIWTTTSANAKIEQIADVGLLTQGQIPSKSPADGYVFSNGEQLEYEATLHFVDLQNTAHDYVLAGKTAHLEPLPTMLVDNFTASLSFDNGTLSVYQGGTLDVTMNHTYNFTAVTAGLDSTKTIHPTLCYEIDGSFTVASNAALANSLGISPDQISLAPKNDGSGNYILKIEYDEQDEWKRAATFSVPLELQVLPNATKGTVVPIKNCWLSLDYDLELDAKTEGEYVAINPSSTLLEANPDTVLKDEDWQAQNGRKALVVPITNTIIVNRCESTGALFFGTLGNGGGLSESVAGHDGTDPNVFGISETIFAPSIPTTDWVVYVAVPSRGQQVRYQGQTSVDSSEDSQFSLQPSGQLQLAGAENATIKYFVPSGTVLVPSMAGLAAETGMTDQADEEADDAIGTWYDWDEMNAEQIANISYARITVPSMESGGTLSSKLLMRLSIEEHKTRVDDIQAYSSMIYNYRVAGGDWRYPATGSGDVTVNGGIASSLVTFTLTDFQVSGYLWQEHGLNNSYTEAEGDMKTSAGMRLSVYDSQGNLLYHQDGTTPVVIAVGADGTYSAPLPRAGQYHLVMEATEKDWLPVSHTSGTNINDMHFVPNTAWPKGTASEKNAAAQITVTSENIQNINGGIEQWGTVAITERLEGAYADRTHAFAATFTPANSTMARSYSGTLTHADGTTEPITLPGGTDKKMLLADGDQFFTRLPVGLMYQVKQEAADGYTLLFSSSENGSEPTLLDASTTRLTDTVSAITYQEDPVDGDGGDVVNMLQKYETVVPTGAGVAGGIWISAGLLCLAGLMLFSAAAKKLKHFRRG